MTARSNNQAKKVTPRALVRKQVENEAFHVSEEDMANLDTSIDSSDHQLNEFGKQLKGDTDKIVSAFDIK